MINNITDKIFKIETALVSCFNSFECGYSTLPTSNAKTINTHQFSAGNCKVVTASTNSNNTPIIMRKMRVIIECILKMLM